MLTFLSFSLTLQQVYYFWPVNKQLPPVNCTTFIVSLGVTLDSNDLSLYWNYYLQMWLATVHTLVFSLSHMYTLSFNFQSLKKVHASHVLVKVALNISSLRGIVHHQIQQSRVTYSLSNLFYCSLTREERKFFLFYHLFQRSIYIKGAGVSRDKFSSIYHVSTFPRFAQEFSWLEKRWVQIRIRPGEISILY